MTALLLAAAAAAYLFVLTKGKAVKALPAVEELFRVVPDASVEPESPVDPRPAIDRLLQVRDQLQDTGRLDDANARAVDQLMLELVHGRVVEAK